MVVDSEDREDRGDNVDEVSEEFPVIWEDPSDPELSWEWDDMHLPAPLPPLAADYVRASIQAGIAYRFARAGIAGRFEVRIINGYAYFAFRYLTTNKAALRATALSARREQSRVMREYWDRKVLPVLLATYGWLISIPVESLPPAELAEVWDELWQRQISYVWGLHFMTTAGSYQALNDLADFYESVVEGASPGEGLALVQGLPNDLQRVQQDLYMLGERTRALPAVAEVILDDPDRALDRMAGTPGGPEFLGHLETFLNAHGHLGQPFDDLMFPSWLEEPGLLLREVRKRLLDPQEEPELRRRRQAAEADAGADRLRARLAGDPARLHELDQLLTHARAVGPLTEGHNYWLDRMMHAHLHRFARRVGRRLTAAGVVADYRDIFFLQAAEVSIALREPVDLSPLVDERTAAHHRWSRIRPPKRLGAPPAPATAGDRFDAPTPVQSDDRLLRGVGASIGSGRGPVRIVHSPDDFERVQQGDVLVCPSANPSWVPLYGIIAGLITDTGGALSHAAVVAREFGVPAVVGTGDATQRLRDGQRVEVNGLTGEVFIIS
ncbi:MAG TPA: PEP-utilizing enzyme [bacterium]|jgi:pyruvate,water dikinase